MKYLAAFIFTLSCAACSTNPGHTALVPTGSDTASRQELSAGYPTSCQEIAKAGFHARTGRDPASAFDGVSRENFRAGYVVAHGHDLNCNRGAPPAGKSLADHLADYQLNEFCDSLDTVYDGGSPFVQNCGAGLIVKN